MISKQARAYLDNAVAHLETATKYEVTASSTCYEVLEVYETAVRKAKAELNKGIVASRPTAEETRARRREKSNG